MATGTKGSLLKPMDYLPAGADSLLSGPVFCIATPSTRWYPAGWTLKYSARTIPIPLGVLRKNPFPWVTSGRTPAPAPPQEEPRLPGPPQKEPHHPGSPQREFCSLRSPQEEPQPQGLLGRAPFSWVSPARETSVFCLLPLFSDMLKKHPQCG